MSVALVERPSGLVGYLDNQERYQTTEGDVAMLANTFADERGIEGQTPLMITAGPAIEVPQALARATLPDPVVVWSELVSAQDFRAYPFTTDEPPTWDELLNILRRNNRNRINAELRDAQANFVLLANSVEAQRDLMLQANAHMAHQGHLVNRRAQEYFQAQQSHLDNREAEMARALAMMRTPLMTVPRWDRALQEAIRNKQYKLRTSSQAKTPGKKGTAGKKGGKASEKVPTTSERAKQSKDAAGRNRSGTVTGPGHPDPDGTSASESRAPTPKAQTSGRGRQWLANPGNAQSNFAASWLERVRNQQLLESETDEESRQGEDSASLKAQRPAADEITETFDVEDRSNTATPNPTGGSNPGNSGGGEQRSGSNR